MSGPFEFLRDRLRGLPDTRHRSLVPRTIDGVHLIETGGRRLLNFGSNDYLGLATSANRDHAASITGSTASALVCGWSSDHQHLADKIATWEGTDRAVLMPSGYAACCGTVATLPGPNDLLLSDALNHASLIDGCRMSKAATKVYRHRDADHVRRIFASCRAEHEQVWIVTDSVFSMDGDIAPLIDLCDLADEFDAKIIVDEAHASGVFGMSGSGMCEELGVKDRVHIRIGTLSKAIGSQGGFVTGPDEVINTLINHCRMLIYSTALSMGAVHAAIESINRIQKTDQHRQTVRHHANRLRESLGVQVANEIESQVPIVPVVLGEDSLTTEASQTLSSAGYFIPAIRPPTVPEGTARLRISLSAAHSDGHIDGLIDQLRSITKTTP